jgi:hypothetical protein
MAWNWFGSKIESEKVFYITLIEDPSYYWYDFDPKTQKRSWTQNPTECLQFASRDEIEKVANRSMGDRHDWQICEACE